MKDSQAEKEYSVLLDIFNDFLNSAAPAADRSRGTDILFNRVTDLFLRRFHSMAQGLSRLDREDLASSLHGASGIIVFQDRRIGKRLTEVATMIRNQSRWRMRSRKK